MIFDILAQESSGTGSANSALSLDCLRLLKNILSDNRVTRKMFAQSAAASLLPDLLLVGKQQDTSRNAASAAPALTSEEHAVNWLLSSSTCC